MLSIDNIENIKKIIEAGEISFDEPLKNHTTFKVGGNADVFITPGNLKEAENIFRLLCCEKVPFIILGNGSNVLVSDDGIRGVVVCLGRGCDKISCNGDEISAEAGALLSKASMMARDNSLTGLEFASGIPGSIGGAIVMNAGAYGGEMKQVVAEVILFDIEKNEVVTLSRDEMEFSYRHSVVKSHPYIVLKVRMKLEKGESELISQTMSEMNAKRREKQPLEYPSAGSTFKRPEGYFAGKLIEDSGLRGYMVGGAQVSEKHCGFVINKDNATATDILELIKDVRSIVLEKYGVTLEPEVCLFGEGMSV